MARLFLADEYLGIALLSALWLLELTRVHKQRAVLQSRNAALETLLRLATAASPYTPTEAAERAALARRMGEAMRLPASRLQLLQDAVRLQNIGYVGADPAALRKKGALSEAEITRIRQHPAIGARILLRLPALEDVAWIVLTHHERPDGQGYPLRLNAGEAPAEASISAVVEAYGSLFYGRGHQERRDSVAAYERIVSLAGTQYDRAAVAALGKVLDLPIPALLTPYLESRPTRGDRHLRQIHLARLRRENAIADRRDGISAESLRLFAPFPEIRGATALRSIGRALRGLSPVPGAAPEAGDPADREAATVQARELFRHHVWTVSLALLAGGLLLVPIAANTPFFPAGNALGTAFLWGSLLLAAATMVIRLPAGGIFTAGSAVAFAIAMLHGPLAGAGAGLLAGFIAYGAATAGDSAEERKARHAAPHATPTNPAGPDTTIDAVHRAMSDVSAAMERSNARATASRRYPDAPPRSREIIDAPSTLTSRRREQARAEARRRAELAEAKRRARRSPMNLAGGLARTSWRRLCDMVCSPRARLPLVYATAAGVAGLFALAGGLSAGHMMRDRAPLGIIAGLLAIGAYAAIEILSLSRWPIRVTPYASPRLGPTDPANAPGIAPLSLMPLPPPLTTAERLEEDYGRIAPEPLVYPASGLLIAMASASIAPWAAGVLFLYPVLWSHLRLEERLRFTDAQLRLLLAISQAIDERHHYTRGHSLRVALYAGAIAREMGYPETYARELRLAAVLHDLGKALWTDDMLDKPHRLAGPEIVFKVWHPVISGMVAEVAFPRIQHAILQHHEDWDGRGYPEQLSGWAMDPGASILRVADALDAITSGRPYKLKEGRKDAIDEILACIHTDFDPVAAVALARVSGRLGGMRATHRRSRRPRPGRRRIAYAGCARGSYPEVPSPAERSRATSGGIFVEVAHSLDARARPPAHRTHLAAIAGFLLERQPHLTASDARALEIAIARNYHLQPWRECSRSAGSAATARRLSLADLDRIAREPGVLARQLGFMGVAGEARELLRRAFRPGTGAALHGARAHRSPSEVALALADGELTMEGLPDTGEIHGIEDETRQVARGLGAAARSLIETRRIAIRRPGQAPHASRHTEAAGATVPPPSATDIFIVARALDRLLTPEPFRRALSLSAAADDLRARAGAPYHPALVEALAGLMTDPERIAGVELGWPEQKGDNFFGHDRSSGLLAVTAGPAGRGYRDRLQHHIDHVRAWALDLGVEPILAELLTYRFERCGGRGLHGLERKDVPPIIARFQIESLFLSLLRHAPRPLTSAAVASALENLSWFEGVLLDSDEIAAFRIDVESHGLPHTLAFMEWDRLTGGVELGREAARDEALLFSFLVSAERASGAVARPLETIELAGF